MNINDNTTPKGLILNNGDMLRVERKKDEVEILAFTTLLFMVNPSG